MGYFGYDNAVGRLLKPTVNLRLRSMDWSTAIERVVLSVRVKVCDSFEVLNRLLRVSRKRGKGCKR